MNILSNRSIGDENQLFPIAPEPGRAGLADLLRSVLGALRRHAWTLLGVAISVFIVLLVLIAQITPKYEAVARLRIDPSRNPIATARDTMAELSDEAIDTEVASIASPEIAREVARQLGLARHPEFATAPSGDGDALATAANQLLGNLDVSREALTYIIRIGYRSTDPALAQRVANSFAEVYIGSRVGGRTSTAQTEVDWYTQQLDAMAGEVRESEAQLAHYRARTGLVEEGANGTITSQQIAPLSGQLAAARSDAAEARAKLTQAERQIRAGGLDAVSEVRSSPVIGDLRRQLAEVTRNLAEITGRYTANHPETIKVRQQIDQLNSQITDEANRAIGSLRADADAASARAASLETAMNDLRAQQSSDTQASVVADGLAREAENRRSAYNRMAQMRLESLQSVRNDIANAQLTDPAQLPLAVSAPNKRLLMALSACVALGLGLAAVGARELFASGLRNLTDIERWLKLPLLASIPSQRGDIPLGDLVIAQPASLYGEALRNARASILGVGGTPACQLVAFTSALPEEGKSTTALAFARLLAMTGVRTLVVECDLRRATLGVMAGVDSATGLVEVLRGEAEFQTAVQSDRQIPGLDLLLVREKTFAVEGLFSDDRMKRLLDDLRTKYQVIIMDLPPIMGVVDARELSNLADGVAFIVRWDSTPARAAASAVSWLRKDNARILGAVLTFVDPKSEAAGGIFYSNKYASYYQKA